MESIRDYKKRLIKEFATKVVNAGFICYLNRNDEYGIYTDKEGTRVCYFQYTDGAVALSGCYKPSKGHGTGWQIGEIPHDADNIKRALYAITPQWARYPDPVYTNLADYLAFYTASGYTLFTPNGAPQRKQITVTFDNGATLSTNINGTVQSAMSYYLGRVFNIGTVSDVMARAVKIDFRSN